MHAVTRVLMCSGLMGLLTPPGWACGPSWPSYYLAFDGSIAVVNLPGKVLGEGRTLSRTGTKGQDWQESLDVDVQQLVEAMGGADLPGVVDAYGAARKAARRPYEERVEKQRYPYGRYGQPPANPAPEIDRDELKAALARVPDEFRFYLRATQSYYCEDYEHAIAWWSRILTLPEPERRYRTTWAIFMIGKAYLHVDPRSAILFFRETRVRATEGFPDPLNLAEASVGWQAKAELCLGHFFEAAAGYCANGDALSQRWVVERALGLPVIDDRFFTDPGVCEQVLTVLERKRFDPDTTKRIYDQVARLAPDATNGLPGRLAHRMYRQGNLDAAEKWIELTPSDDPNGRWVRSKLLLREGNVDEAMQLLRALAREFPAFTASVPVEDDFGDITNPFLDDLGVLELGRGNFVEALDCMARGGFFPDVAYVAEAVLTPGELQTYLKVHADDAALHERKDPERKNDPMSVYDLLSWIYARRVARDGKWSEAAKYYPDGIVSPRTRWYSTTRDGEPVADIVERVMELQHPQGPRATRGETSMDLAFAIRQHGMELMGTECAPDWGLTAGILTSHLNSRGTTMSRIRYADDVSELEARFNYRIPQEQRRPIPKVLLTILRASESEVERYRRSRPVPDKQFHYRYVASNIMWEAASLLPDNDLRTAQALLIGGTWIEKRDPKPADRFYKALVRRCRKLTIGQEADTLRWFPSVPPDWKKGRISQ